MNFLCDKNGPFVDTDKGRIRGYFFNNIYHFKGIPYAKAERFCPPVEVDPWDEN